MKIGLGPIFAGHRGDHGHVGHRPQPMHHAQVVDRLQRRLSGDGRVQQRVGLQLGVRVQAEDLAQVRLAAPR